MVIMIHIKSETIKTDDQVLVSTLSFLVVSISIVFYYYYQLMLWVHASNLCANTSLYSTKLWALTIQLPTSLLHQYNNSFTVLLS